MALTETQRKKFAHLAKPRGPKPGWQCRAARDLGFSQSHISNLVAGRAQSPVALAALDDWKARNLPPAAVPNS